MICERCSRGMEYVANAGDWWCSHCHHRVAAAAPAAAAPAAAGPAAVASPVAPTSPAAAPVPRPVTPGGSQPAAIPAPIASDGSRPAAQPAVRRRTWPMVMALVLALVAVGMVGAVVVRAGGASAAAVDTDTLRRLAPAESPAMRAINWTALQRTPIGRELLREISVTMFRDVVKEACGADVDSAVAWMAHADTPGRIFGGVTLVRLRWTREEVESCAHKALEVEKQSLQIHNAGALTSYTVGDDPVWLAWLDDQTLLVTSEWKPEKQRGLLEELLARDDPPEASVDLERALTRVDRSAGYWVAMRAPSKGDPQADDPSDDDPFDDFGLDDPDGVAGWYEETLSVQLGSRPDSIYFSVELGSTIELRAGAVYKSEVKAKRVADKLRRFLERAGGGGVTAPGLDRLDPAMRAEIERRFREGAGRIKQFRAALIGAAEVELDGDVVTVRARVDADVLGDEPARGARRLLDEINGLLPRELQLRM